MRALFGILFTLLWIPAALAANPSTAQWQGARTSGHGVTYMNSGQGVTLQDAANSSTVFGALSITGVNYPGGGAVPAASNNFLWMNQTSVTGQCTASGSFPTACPLSQISITGDQLNSINARFIPALEIIHSFGGGSANGNGWGGIAIQLTQTGTVTANTNNVVGLFKGAMNASTGGGLGSEVGGMFGLNPDVTASSAATHIVQLIGEEIDMSYQTGSSGLDKIGLQIISTSLDQSAPSRANIGGTVATQNNGTNQNFLCGWCIGNAAGFNGVATGGTLFGGWAHLATAPGTTIAGTVAHGLDVSGFTFSSDSIKAPGFVVDPSGNATANSIITPTVTAAANGLLTLGNVTDGAAVRIADSGGTTINVLGITPGQTGQNVTVSCGGPSSDPNVNCAFNSKGTGAFLFTTGGGKEFQINNTPSAVDFISLTGSATGSPGVVSISASGSDTDVSIALTPKGAGTVKFSTSSTGASTQTFTNSPCTGTTTEKWIPVSITGQTGTWFVPACQ